MTPALFTADGQPLRLGNRIGRGGEGEVYALEGHTELAVKYYTINDKASREAKIRQMVVDQLATKSPLIAFPRSLVFERGRFVGFTMQKVTAHQPLHELYSPGARKSAFPQADYKFLVVAAANVARAVGQTHANGCVIGDINHSGILIAQNAMVTLIDADSFQIPNGGRFFLCNVGVPEYTAPELQGKALGQIVRTTNHDAFGLAVVIFQLLFMGRHPFGGRPTAGDIPLEKAIAENRFAYSQKRQVGMTPPPAAPTLADFPSEIGAAFETAFAPGNTSRPTAKQWMSLLDDLGTSLKTCAANSLHKYPAVARECPWCRMEARFLVPLFLPKQTAFDPNATFTSFAGDVAAIWKAIDAIHLPPPKAFPTSSAASVMPTMRATDTNKHHGLKLVAGWACILIAAALPFVSIGFWWLAAAAGWAGYKIMTMKPDTTSFVSDYVNLQTRVLQAHSEWTQHGGEYQFTKTKEALRAKKVAYDGLQAEEKKRIDEHNARRRTDQLQTFLERFRIQHSKIARVGPAKQQMLLSYGIESAADITIAAVIKVPGFGPVNSQGLVDWRQKLERRFVFNAAPTAADQAAIYKIKGEIAAKAAKLKAELAAGPAMLTQLANAAPPNQVANQPLVLALLKQRDQALADLSYLGLPVPSVTAPTRPGSPPASSNPTIPPRYQPQPTTPPAHGLRCPTCKSLMVIRTARRGSRAGSKFYGCSRYPACSTTRPYP